MKRNKYGPLEEGFCLIRKGRMNTRAKRSDFDFMYFNKGEFEIRFLEQALHAVHNYKDCASIEMAFTNSTELPVTIIGGTLHIRNYMGEELSRHHIHGMN